MSEKRIGTYVEVDMYGLPTDTIRREFRTKTVPNNGLNPYYNEDPFVFRKIILPDLACLRIGVFEETGKLIGQRVLPLDGLQAGYRHISLRTEGNFPLSLPTLFCHIVLKTYVPDGLSDFVDALNNPKEFLTKEEKRLRQLKDKLGIDEKEITSIPSEKKSFKIGGGGSSGAGAAAAGAAGSANAGAGACGGSAVGAGGSLGVSGGNAAAGIGGAESVKFKSANNEAVVSSSLHASASSSVMTSSSGGGGGGSACSYAVIASTSIATKDIEKIIRDTLKTTKSFQKLLKKQTKENEALKKKQNKERALMQKQHSATIDKVAANYDKSTINFVGANNSSLITSSVNDNFTNVEASAATATGNHMNENNYKQKMKELVEEQSRVWANLIERQQTEDKQLNNEHVEQQCVHFQQLLQEAQKQRKKEIEARQKK